MDIQSLSPIMILGYSVLSGVVMFLWTELKDQRKRVDDLQKEMATQNQLREVEKRIMDSVGGRFEAIVDMVNNVGKTCDTILQNMLKRNSDKD